MLTVAEAPGTADARAIAAGGFRDTTRVASGSPRMARDICLTNSAPLLVALDAYLNRLQALRQQLAGEDPAIEETFTTARAARNEWLPGK